MSAVFYVTDAVSGVDLLAEQGQEVDLVFTSPPFFAARTYLDVDDPNAPLELGQEATPGEYIDNLLSIVDMLPRVLSPTGSVCIELADTYWGSGGAGGDYREGHRRGKQQKYKGPTIRRPKDSDEAHPALKSLMMVPETVRWAMAYGFNPLTGTPHQKWRIRNVIRWCRPNPQVGALTDKWRPATSEMLVATLAADRYWYPSYMRDGSPPLRDWWEIAAYAFKGDHHAVMNRDVVIPAIDAMTPQGGTVLDPFAGSGTTLMVASGMGRNAIGFDLDRRNADLVRERCGLFVDVIENP